MAQEGGLEQGSRAAPPAALSPDGLFYWSGVAWLSTLSADGRWRWDGRQWLPTMPVAKPAVNKALRRRARVVQWLLAGWIAAVGLDLFVAQIWFSFDALGDHFAQRWGVITTVLAIAILIASGFWLTGIAGAVRQTLTPVRNRLLLGLWAGLFLAYVASDVILAEPVRAVAINGPETRWQILVSAGLGVAAAIAAIVLVGSMTSSDSESRVLPEVEQQ